MERQLRDLLEIAAGDPPRPVTAGSVHRRMMRRRLLEYGGAAVAVALVAGLAVAAAARGIGPVPAPAAPAPSLAGVPRYYIEQGPAGGKLPVTTVVRATATGRVKATVRCPWRGHPSPATGSPPPATAPFS
jgi:hypothetical protein